MHFVVIVRMDTKGIFSNRLTNEKSQCSIGVDNYESLCRKCYLEKKTIKEYIKHT